MSGVQSSAPLTLVTGHEDAHTSILWVVGPLDDLTADSFETECKRVASRSRLLIIELSSCSFLSSAGLRAFVRLQRGLPGAIALVTADARFEMLFRLAGLERRLPRFASGHRGAGRGRRIPHVGRRVADVRARSGRVAFRRSQRLHARASNRNPRDARWGLEPRCIAR